MAYKPGFKKTGMSNLKFVLVESVIDGDSETTTSEGYFVTTDSGYQKSEDGNPLTVGRICTVTGN